jgi:hypothetical protein
MHRGGRPSGKTAATITKERQTEEAASPQKYQKRLEEDKYKKFNFFSPHV